MAHQNRESIKIGKASYRVIQPLPCDRETKWQEKQHLEWLQLKKAIPHIFVDQKEETGLVLRLGCNLQGIPLEALTLPPKRFMTSHHITIRRLSGLPHKLVGDIV